MRAPARPLRPRRRAQRTPKALPLDSMSSTLFSFDDATIFITLVILATLFVARMRSLTARGEAARARERRGGWREGPRPQPPRETARGGRQARSRRGQGKESARGGGAGSPPRAKGAGDSLSLSLAGVDTL